MGKVLFGVCCSTIKRLKLLEKNYAHTPFWTLVKTYTIKSSLSEKMCTIKYSLVGHIFQWLTDV